MAARFQKIDRGTPMLLPACIQEWVPENDLAHLTADSTPLQDGLTIQGEIVRREHRLAKLKTAREGIEARAREAAALEKAERGAALAERATREANGEKLRGKAPAGPESVKETAAAKDQYNYTDPENRERIRAELPRPGCRRNRQPSHRRPARERRPQRQSTTRAHPRL